MHGNAFRNHAAKSNVHRVRVSGRYWYFTFSDRWGPTLTDAWGESVDNTPLADDSHRFWDAFETWLAARDCPAPTNRSEGGGDA